MRRLSEAILPILSVSRLSAFLFGISFPGVLPQSASVRRFFVILSVSTLSAFFFWDSFFMLHAHFVSLQDLRREAPASLEARFSADRSTFSKKTLFFFRKSYLFW